tara:strand:- start:296 stop:499 length:204 start_codon:yes stop_codon:yes gene_type:complete
MLLTTTISASSIEIIKDYGDDMIGALHPKTGYVGIYMQDEDVLFPCGNLMKNPNKTPIEIADQIWGA